MSSYCKRNIYYVAAPDIGMGHFLVATAVLKHLAEKLDRQFHIICNRWNMTLNKKADQSPIFKHFFCQQTLAESGVNISISTAVKTLEWSHRNKGSFLIVGNKGQGVKRLQRIFVYPSVIDDTEFMPMSQYQSYILDDRDHPADNIVVDSMTPFQSSSQVMSFYDEIPPFLAFDKTFSRKYKKLENYVGVHIRHGNGEYLHGRIEGGSPEFDTLLDGIVSEAKQLSERRRLQMIAFSDNVPLLKMLESEHGIVSLNTKFLPGDEIWRDHLKQRASSGRRRIVETVLRDIYCLSRCSHVVCGTSLFTIAAYIYSPYKNFVEVKV